MSQTKPPCYKCSKHTPTCHGTCEAYKAYAAEQEAIRQARYTDHGMDGYQQQKDSVQRYRKTTCRFQKAGMKRW